MLNVPVIVIHPNQSGRVPLVAGQVVDIQLELGHVYLVKCRGTKEVTRVPKNCVRQMNSAEMAKWSKK